MATQPEPLRLLTVREVAEMVRLPEATLRYYRATGKGPKSGKLGGHVLYREADVLAWVREAFKEQTA